MKPLALATRIGKDWTAILITASLLLLSYLSGLIIARGYWLPLCAFAFAAFVMIRYRGPVGIVLLFISAEIGGNLLHLHYGLPLHVRIGTISFAPVDILPLGLVVMIIIRSVKYGFSIWFEKDVLWIFSIFTVLVMIGIIRGMSIYMHRSVGGGATAYVSFVSLCLYLSSYRLSKIQLLGLFRWSGVFVGILVFIGLLRFLGVIPGVIAEGIKINRAHQVLFILFILFTLVVFQINSRKTAFAMYFWSFALLVYVVLQRHRSVWVAAIIGTGMLLLFFRTRLTKLIPFVWLSILFVSLICITSPQIASRTIAYIQISATEPFQLSETSAWRLKAWTTTLENLDSVAKWMIGIGFGARLGIGDWNRSAYGPHNAYVATISRLGVIGMAVFALFVYKLETKIYLIRRETTDEFTHNVMSILFICIIASLGYMIAYEVDIYISILFGIAMSCATHQEELLRTNTEKSKNAIFAGKPRRVSSRVSQKIEYSRERQAQTEPEKGKT